MDDGKVDCSKVELFRENSSTNRRPPLTEDRALIMFISATRKINEIYQERPDPYKRS